MVRVDALREVAKMNNKTIFIGYWLMSFILLSLITFCVYGKLDWVYLVIMSTVIAAVNMFFDYKKDGAENE